MGTSLAALPPVVSKTSIRHWWLARAVAGSSESAATTRRVFTMIVSWLAHARMW
jgi:hypothetical protein